MVGKEWWRKAWPTLAVVVLVSVGIGWHARQLTRDLWQFSPIGESYWLAPHYIRSFRLRIVGLALLFVPVAVAFSARLAKDLFEPAAERSENNFERHRRLARHRRFAIQSPLLFFFAYLATLNLLNFFAFTSLWEPPRNLSSLYSFWIFWLGSESGGIPLMTAILWLDVLAAVYLWVSFRTYRTAIRKTGLSSHFYLFYVACILMLVALHGHYYRLSHVQPPYQLFRVHVTDGTPEDGGSRQERLERLEARLRQEEARRLEAQESTEPEP